MTSTDAPMTDRQTTDEPRSDHPTAKADRMIDRRFDRAERHLPEIFRAWLAHLRKPSASWIRIPVGVLMMVGGLFSFLPVLGLWMLPLGLLLLALDVALLKRPAAVMVVVGERRWRRLASWWRQRR
ncbi:hypothetical protein [Azospirillum sp. ST 5-10]|uniref:hypothetical protein n=2 Tax=unclassified Azospirillum TaxID=2630922 RepID=UPI003F4A72A4